MQTRLRHQRQQARRLEGHRLATGVGTRDEQRRVRGYQFDVHGCRRIRQPVKIVGIARDDASHEQRMARGEQFEPAILRQLRRDGASDLRQPGLGLQHVELGRHLLGSGHIVVPHPEGVGQRQQDAQHLLGFLRFELHDFVVDLDGRQRLQIQRLAAGRTAVDQAGQRRAMLGLHQEDEAAIALGDDLVLQISGGLFASQVSVQGLPQLRALAPQAVANRSERGAGVDRRHRPRARWHGAQPRFLP